MPNAGGIATPPHPSASESGSGSGSSGRNSVPDPLRALYFVDIPALTTEPTESREDLFLRKLRMCSYVFSFNDYDETESDADMKDTKRQTLLEVYDYINNQAGQAILSSERVMEGFVSMVKTNIDRALPAQMPNFNPEEDEPDLEPSWPHLQVVYELFLRFVVSGEVKANAAKKYIDKPFLLVIINLFDASDPRERDYLKTILHRIYGKFMSHRSYIRKSIFNVFYSFVYEKSQHNGIMEYLEIFGSIINGFAIPLKKEHLTFLEKAIMPLHTPPTMGHYYQQLSYCVLQYVEKDANTGGTIVNALIKLWPWSSAQKQVLLLNEMEELLELLGYEQLEKVRKGKKKMKRKAPNIRERRGKYGRDGTLRWICSCFLRRQSAVPCFFHFIII